MHTKMSTHAKIFINRLYIGFIPCILDISNVLRFKAYLNCGNRTTTPINLRWELIFKKS